MAATITTMDERVRKVLEPGGCASLKRFEMLKTFRKTNASVGLHVMPIIPYLTDSEENIDALFEQAKVSDVHYVLPGTLYLRGKTRGYFFDFIKTEYPHLFEKLCLLYKTGGAGKEYKEILYQMVNRLREKYALSNSYSAQIKLKMFKEKTLFGD